MDKQIYKFTSVFTEIGHNVHRIKTECMAEFGLKSSHLFCLYYLYNNSPLCTTELLKLCCEDKGSLSRTIKYLKENGYIVSRNSLTNIYRVPLTLTEKGMNTGEKITKKISALFPLANSGISNEEKESMYKTLEKISTNLNKINVPHSAF